jgi:hypothetical protein
MVFYIGFIGSGIFSPSYVGAFHIWAFWRAVESGLGKELVRSRFKPWPSIQALL